MKSVVHEREAEVLVLERHDRTLGNIQRRIRRLSAFFGGVAGLWIVYLLFRAGELLPNEFGDAINPAITLGSIAAAVFSLIYLLEQLREVREGHRSRLAPFVFLVPSIEIVDLYWNATRRRFSGILVLCVRAHNSGSEGRHLEGRFEVEVRDVGRASFVRPKDGTWPREFQEHRLAAGQDSTLLRIPLDLVVPGLSSRFLVNLFADSRRESPEIVLRYGAKLRAQDDSCYSRDGVWLWSPGEVWEEDLKRELSEESLYELMALCEGEYGSSALIEERVRDALEQLKEVKLSPRSLSTGEGDE